MQDHHLQTQILHKLVLSEAARFADLRPKNIDSNVFTYHLKQLMRDKLVTKTEAGVYSLTPLGRVAGINVTLNKRQLLEQAHSVILMALYSPEKGWLLRRRLAQPMFNKVGFTHAEPEANHDALTSARETFLERTGLTVDFEPRGYGYVRLFRDGELESFVHFVLYYAEEYSGELIEQSRNGENFWLKEPDFTDESMIPSMPPLIERLTSGDKMFYLDLKYDLA